LATKCYFLLTFVFFGLRSDTMQLKKPSIDQKIPIFRFNQKSLNQLIIML